MWCNIGLQGDDVFFAATGVSDGDLLQGVRYYSGGASTTSLVMRARSGTGAQLQQDCCYVCIVAGLLLCIHHLTADLHAHSLTVALRACSFAAMHEPCRPLLLQASAASLHSFLSC